MKLLRQLTASVIAVIATIFSLISIIACALTVVLGITAVFVAIGALFYYMLIGSQPDLHVNTSHKDMYTAFFVTILLPFISTFLCAGCAKFAKQLGVLARRIHCD